MKDELGARLELFIKRYYSNRLLKGVIYTVGLSTAYFFILTLLELFGQFSSNVRTVLFFLLLAGLAIIVGVYIALPIFKLLGFGKRLTYAQAARLIGGHFKNIDDKLLNTIQLQGLSDRDSSLIKASIDQRISELKPVPFQRAIDFRENKKYAPLLLVPVILFGIVALTGFWEDFSNSSRRIAQYSEDFVPEAPFRFVLLNSNLKVEEGSDLLLELDFEGGAAPTESYIVLNNNTNRMTRRPDGVYQFRLNNLKQSIELSFKASGWNSATYQVLVVPVPKIKNVLVSVKPPPYTGIQSYTGALRPVMDVPQGSIIQWNLDLDQSNQASMLSASGNNSFTRKEAGKYFLESQLTKSLVYTIQTQNEFVERSDIKDHRIDVIPDRFPEIIVKFDRDSLSPMKLFIEGEVVDDYGFSALKLIVEGEGVKTFRDVPIAKSTNKGRFADLVVLDSLMGEETTNLRIYLKVWDNDGVNGAKSSTSEVFDLTLLGKKEQEKVLEEQMQAYLDSESDMKKKDEEIDKILADLLKELQSKKNLSWKDKNKVEELLKKQQELLKKQQDRAQKLEAIQKDEDKLSKKSEELKKKEEEINKLTEKDKELEDLMKEIESLMEKLNTEQLAKKLEKMQELNEQNQQSEERKDDLLKDLQFQKDVLKEAEKLKELSKKMKQLSEDVSQDIEKTDEQKEQEKINEEFEESLEKIEKLREENKTFDEEAEKEKLDEQAEEAKSEMKQAEQSLEKNENAPANKSQSEASESMDEMSESMQMAMMNMQSQKNEENIETLRQILENLKTLSFSIEDLSLQSRNTGKNDPSFKYLLTEQKRLQDGAAIIKDSLVALGNRVPQLQQVVFTELALIDKNLDASIQQLEELQSAQAAANQQMVMTSANNLALMLDETMQSMMQAQAQMMKGNQNCQKPGGKNPKPSMQNMRKMQGELGKKMQQIKEGSKPGKGKTGKQMSKEMVEMISRQEQLRQGLEGMLKEMEGTGSKGNLQKAIDEMKELEMDMWDGELSNNYLERIQSIETRLLESEKAELKQKEEKRREAEVADDTKQLYKEELEKYLREKGIEQENIDRVPVNFHLYYRNQATEYLKLQ